MRGSDSGRPGYFLSGHGAGPGQHGRDRAGRSRGRYVNGFTGGGGGGGTISRRACSLSLKPLDEAKAHRRSGDAAAAAKLARVPGRDALSCRLRRTCASADGSSVAYQFTMRGDNLHGSDDLWAPQMLPRAAQHPDDHRREQRSAEQRAAVDGAIRPRHRVAFRHLAATDRQHAVRRFRPAPGLDHVHAAQSVPRGDGGGAAILAGSPIPDAEFMCARPTGSRSR